MYLTFLLYLEKQCFSQNTKENDKTYNASQVKNLNSSMM